MNKPLITTESKKEAREVLLAARSAGAPVKLVSKSWTYTQPGRGIAVAVWFSVVAR